MTAYDPTLAAAAIAKMRRCSLCIQQCTCQQCSTCPRCKGADQLEAAVQRIADLETALRLQTEATDRALAEVEAMRPVVEAALAHCDQRPIRPQGSSTLRALEDELDRYRHTPIWLPAGVSKEQG